MIISKFWLIFLLAIFYATIEVTALYHLKKRKIIVAIMCYSLIICILLKAYEYSDIGYMNLMTSIVSISLSFTISHLYLGEKVNTYVILSIACVILAIYFAHLAEE